MPPVPNANTNGGNSFARFLRALVPLSFIRRNYAARDDTARKDVRNIASDRYTDSVVVTLSLSSPITVVVADK